MQKLAYSLLFVVGSFAVAQSNPISAKEITASDLQQICSSQNRDADAPCRFYIMGIVQGITIGLGMADGKVALGRPCIPDDMQVSKLETLIKAKLGADLMVNPGDKELPASSFVGAVIATTFQCNKAR
ncbi:MAG TPA: Rap1a/Tai family immunity protein [Candidatus Acidoferrales bacterium]|nr:Rap1a/Tai family immunity protein [Candidatus Acidoferrales bacterium]